MAEEKMLPRPGTRAIMHFADDSTIVLYVPEPDPLDTIDRVRRQVIHQGETLRRVVIETVP